MLGNNLRNGSKPKTLESHLAGAKLAQGLEQYGYRFSGVPNFEASCG